MARKNFNATQASSRRHHRRKLAGVVVGTQTSKQDQRLVDEESGSTMKRQINRCASLAMTAAIIAFSLISATSDCAVDGAYLSLSNGSSLSADTMIAPPPPPPTTTTTMTTVSTAATADAQEFPLESRASSQWELQRKRLHQFAYELSNTVARGRQHNSTSRVQNQQVRIGPMVSFSAASSLRPPEERYRNSNGVRGLTSAPIATTRFDDDFEDENYHTQRGPLRYETTFTLSPIDVRSPPTTRGLNLDAPQLVRIYGTAQRPSKHNRTEFESWQTQAPTKTHTQTYSDGLRKRRRRRPQRPAPAAVSVGTIGDHLAATTPLSSFMLSNGGIQVHSEPIMVVHGAEAAEALADKAATARSGASQSGGGGRVVRDDTTGDYDDDDAYATTPMAPVAQAGALPAKTLENTFEFEIDNNGIDTFARRAPSTSEPTRATFDALLSDYEPLASVQLSSSAGNYSDYLDAADEFSVLTSATRPDEHEPSSPSSPPPPSDVWLIADESEPSPQASKQQPAGTRRKFAGGHRKSPSSPSSPSSSSPSLGSGARLESRNASSAGIRVTIGQNSVPLVVNSRGLITAAKPRRPILAQPAAVSPRSPPLRPPPSTSASTRPTRPHAQSAHWPLATPTAHQTNSATHLKNATVVEDLFPIEPNAPKLARKPQTAFASSTTSTTTTTTTTTTVAPPPLPTIASLEPLERPSFEFGLASAQQQHTRQTAQRRPLPAQTNDDNNGVETSNNKFAPSAATMAKFGQQLSTPYRNNNNNSYSNNTAILFAASHHHNDSYGHAADLAESSDNEVDADHNHRFVGITTKQLAAANNNSNSNNNNNNKSATSASDIWPPERTQLTVHLSASDLKATHQMANSLLRPIATANGSADDYDSGDTRRPTSHQQQATGNVSMNESYPNEHSNDEYTTELTPLPAAVAAQASKHSILISDENENENETYLAPASTNQSDTERYVRLHLKNTTNSMFTHNPPYKLAQLPAVVAQQTGGPKQTAPGGSQYSMNRTSGVGATGAQQVNPRPNNRFQALANLANTTSADLMADTNRRRRRPTQPAPAPPPQPQPVPPPPPPPLTLSSGSNSTSATSYNKPPYEPPYEADRTSALAQHNSAHTSFNEPANSPISAHHFSNNSVQTLKPSNKFRHKLQHLIIGKLIRPQLLSAANESHLASLAMAAQLHQAAAAAVAAAANNHSSSTSSSSSPTPQPSAPPLLSATVANNVANLLASKLSSLVRPINQHHLFGARPAQSGASAGTHPSAASTASLLARPLRQRYGSHLAQAAATHPSAAMHRRTTGVGSLLFSGLVYGLSVLPALMALTGINPLSSSSSSSQPEASASESVGATRAPPSRAQNKQRKSHNKRHHSSKPKGQQHKQSTPEPAPTSTTQTTPSSFAYLVPLVSAALASSSASDSTPSSSSSADSSAHHSDSFNEPAANAIRSLYAPPPTILDATDASDQSAASGGVFGLTSSSAPSSSSLTSTASANTNSPFAESHPFRSAAYLPPIQVHAVQPNNEFVFSLSSPDELDSSAAPDASHLIDQFPATFRPARRNRDLSAHMLQRFELRAPVVANGVVRTRAQSQSQSQLQPDERAPTRAPPAHEAGAASPRPAGDESGASKEIAFDDRRATEPALTHLFGGGAGGESAASMANSLIQAPPQPPQPPPSPVALPLHYQFQFAPNSNGLVSRARLVGDKIRSMTSGPSNAANSYDANGVAASDNNNGNSVGANNIDNDDDDENENNKLRHRHNHIAQLDQSQPMRLIATYNNANDNSNSNSNSNSMNQMQSSSLHQSAVAEVPSVDHVAPLSFANVFDPSQVVHSAQSAAGALKSGAQLAPDFAILSPLDALSALRVALQPTPPYLDSSRVRHLQLSAPMAHLDSDPKPNLMAQRSRRLIGDTSGDSQPPSAERPIVGGGGGGGGGGIAAPGFGRQIAQVNEPENSRASTPTSSVGATTTTTTTGAEKQQAAIAAQLGEGSIGPAEGALPKNKPTSSAKTGATESGARAAAATTATTAANVERLSPQAQYYRADGSTFESTRPSMMSFDNQWRAISVPKPPPSPSQVSSSRPLSLSAASKYNRPKLSPEETASSVARPPPPPTPPPTVSQTSPAASPKRRRHKPHVMLQSGVVSDITYGKNEATLSEPMRREKPKAKRKRHKNADEPRQSLISNATRSRLEDEVAADESRLLMAHSMAMGSKVLNEPVTIRS